MTRRRVVVTGMGAVSGLGPDVASAWQTLLSGDSVIRRRTVEPGPCGPPSRSYPIATPDSGFAEPLHAFVGKPICQHLDPAAAFVLCASFEALDQAGLNNSPVLGDRTAVVMGHGMCGLSVLEQCYERFYGRKSPRVHPQTVPRVMVSAGVSAISMTFGIRGPAFATSSACASSAHAIVQGASLISSGLCDVALTGGSEAIATAGGMGAWESIQALSKCTCRPFSIGRDGLAMGEGGAALVLEEHEHAHRRGARILGEFIGSGMTSDAFHLTQPGLTGPVNAIRQACRGIADVESILVSAHGTGTPLNDANEAEALNTVLGLRRHPVIATKSAHGHLIGGTAALQAVIGLMALQEGLAPPILNYLGPDPDCDLDLVIAEPRPISSSHLLVNAFAFGGLNVSMVFSTPTE